MFIRDDDSQRAVAVGIYIGMALSGLLLAVAAAYLYTIDGFAITALGALGMVMHAAGVWLGRSGRVDALLGSIHSATLLGSIAVIFAGGAVLLVGVIASVNWLIIPSLITLTAGLGISFFSLGISLAPPQTAARS